MNKHNDRPRIPLNLNNAQTKSSVSGTLIVKRFNIIHLCTFLLYVLKPSSSCTLKLLWWRRSTDHTSPLLWVCTVAWRKACSQNSNFIKFFAICKLKTYCRILTMKLRNGSIKKLVRQLSLKWVTHSSWTEDLGPFQENIFMQTYCEDDNIYCLFQPNEIWFSRLEIWDQPILFTLCLHC